MKIKNAIKICQNFANKHKLIYQDEGEIGFGRECVGFLAQNGNYLSHNPLRLPEYNPIKEYECENVYPPEGVDAYHKHDCLAVLGRGDKAIKQLAKWVENIETFDNVKVVEFKTGATGIQAVFSGVTGYAVIANNEKDYD